jgi:Bifunctional DNA primase/polymerase, N-terminal/Phage integrase family/Primase C terminal 1 (PriCT-1)
VRPNRVVLVPPRRPEHPRLGQRAEHLGVQQLVPHLAVERLRVPVLPRTRRGDVQHRLRRRHGPLPRTPLVATGGGGAHHYFRCPPGLRTFTVEGDGLQVKGENSYVVAPPSAHATGRTYRWVIAPDGIDAGVEAGPFADLPPWLLAAAHALAAPAVPGPSSDPPAGPNVLVLPADLTTCPGVGEGRRHDALMRYAGVHFARQHEDVLALALVWASRCSPPFTPAEATKTVTGIWRSHQRKQWSCPAPVGEERSFPPPPSATATTSFFTNGVGDEDEDPTEDGTATFLTDGPVEDEGGEYVVVPMAAPPAPTPPAWPALDADAFHGLLGAVVRAVEPQTEADPAGVLLCRLTAFGNAAGRGPTFAVGTDRHHANLFAILVGDTAAGKGQAQGVADWLMSRADPDWHGRCQCHGLGTGDGLVERLRDTKYTARRVQQIVKEYAEAAGVLATPHTFRHQAITWLTRHSGLADAELQLLTGHARRETLAVYQHVALDGDLEGKYQAAMRQVDL